jgi:glycosyltransferase involved in cell wall biosynthesis
MKIVIVLTYPVYYDGIDLTQWLKQPCRERQMAAIMADMGHEAELWAVDHIDGDEHQIDNDVHQTINGNELQEKGAYKVRIFKPDQTPSRQKAHFSQAMEDYAHRHNADLHLLKGVDGGIGQHLIKVYLKKNRKKYGFIIGGGFYTHNVPKAEIVMYESEAQKQKLMRPGFMFWRKPVPEQNLIRLPKLIDTELFTPYSPYPSESKTYDILVTGRLISRVKNYDAVGMLSRRLRVAVAGDGADAARLKKLYPDVRWLGHVPNQHLPRYLNRAHLFMHTSYIDYYPRVIAESLAAGVPVIAFAGIIEPDVLPPECGLLVPKNDFMTPILDLLNHRDRLDEMSRQARRHAIENCGLKSCRDATADLLQRIQHRLIKN